jgi:hypothetical protein
MPAASRAMRRVSASRHRVTEPSSVGIGLVVKVSQMRVSAQPVAGVAIARSGIQAELLNI